MDEFDGKINYDFTDTSYSINFGNHALTIEALKEFLRGNKNTSTSYNCTPVSVEDKLKQKYKQLENLLHEIDELEKEKRANEGVERSKGED